MKKKDVVHYIQFADGPRLIADLDCIEVQRGLFSSKSESLLRREKFLEALNVASHAFSTMQRLYNSMVMEGDFKNEN